MLGEIFARYLKDSATMQKLFDLMGKNKPFLNVITCKECGRHLPNKSFKLEKGCKWCFDGANK